MISKTKGTRFMIPSLKFNFKVSTVALLISCSLSCMLAQANGKTATPKLTVASKDACPAEVKEVVLISKAGKPILTEAQLEAIVAEIKESDQRYAMMFDMQPEEILRQVIDGKERDVVINDWAEKNNVRQSVKYKDKKAAIEDKIKSMLDHEAFLDMHQVKVTDKDIRDYYEKNKQQMVSRPGGIETYGIAFVDEAKAKEFLQKVECHATKDLIKVANAMKLSAEVEELGAINNQSYAVDDAIKKEVLQLKSFPSVKIVHINSGDKAKYWVIQATGMREAEYMPFEQAAERLAQMLQPAKVQEMLDTEIPKLAEKAKITKNSQAIDEYINKYNENAKKNLAAMQCME
jgi:hypothetical protein